MIHSCKLICQILRGGIVLSLFVLLYGCATNIPQVIRKAPAEDITLNQVRQTPEAYMKRNVRWGGTIIAIDNLKNETRLTVLAQPFAAYGEPVQGDESYGRFIAIIKGFLDPAIYARGRAITVYGQLSAMEKKKVDEFDYLYPVVNVSESWLWEVYQEWERDYHPFWWWHDPFYPYYYPYRHRHY